MDINNLSVGEIQKIVGGMSLEEKKLLIPELEADTRQGVRKIGESLIRQVEAYNREVERINRLKKYEMEYFKKGAKYICGIDEVGRGPLAGPVYACAAVLPIDAFIEGVNDSKKLTPEKRKSLYAKIKEKAISCEVGMCDEATIDRINILNATFCAMRMAVEKLSVKPQVLLIDAVRIPKLDIFQVPIIKGDSLSFSIAAASIVAKVERDEYMNKLHKEYPVYNFESNKGYGTKEHIEALQKYGPCPVHRRSFIGNFI